MSEIERMRSEHVQDGDPGDPHCAMCSDASYPIWPCDAAILMALVSEQAREIERLVAALLDILREAAWESRLTEWRKHSVTAVGTQPTPQEACREIRAIARAALAAASEGA